VRIVGGQARPELALTLRKEGIFARQCNARRRVQRQLRADEVRKRLRRRTLGSKPDHREEFTFSLHREKKKKGPQIKPFEAWYAMCHPEQKKEDGGAAPTRETRVMAGGGAKEHYRSVTSGIQSTTLQTREKKKKEQRELEKGSSPTQRVGKDLNPAIKAIRCATIGGGGQVLKTKRRRERTLSGGWEVLALPGK